MSAAIATPSGVALADTVHQIRFATPAKVLVWQNGALTGEGQIVNLFSRPMSPLQTPLGSGVLQSVTATEPLDTQRAVVKIASNSGFAIKATDPTAAASMDVRLIGYGPNAQFRPGALSLATGIVFAQSEKPPAIAAPLKRNPSSLNSPGRAQLRPPWRSLPFTIDRSHPAVRPPPVRLKES